jgi:hypothetical protein
LKGNEKEEILENEWLMMGNGETAVNVLEYGREMWGLKESWGQMGGSWTAENERDEY